MPLLGRLAKNSVPAMKGLLATLLLLFQLQPIVGTAACLTFSDRAAATECEMPDDEAMPYGSLVQAGSPTPMCALASICAASSLAIPSVPEGNETVVPHHSTALLAVALTFTDVASPPPFHPPKA